MERRFFVEENEEMDGERGGGDCGDESRVGMTEDDPQADPADRKANIHPVPHITIKSHDYQALGRNHRGGRAAPGPAEIPHTAERDRESEYRWDRGQPAPAGLACGVDLKAEPSREQPEPEREECRADQHGG